MHLKFEHVENFCKRLNANLQIMLKHALGVFKFDEYRSMLRPNCEM